MTDDQIIELYFARSENAITQTDSLYGKYFRYIAKNILNDDADADEITNDVYLKAWNLMPPERPNSLKAYLGKITRSLAINRLEKKTAEKRGGGEYDAVLEELQDCIASGNGEEFHDKIILRDALQKFLLQQPLQVRRIFIRRYWYMSSIAEIAKDHAFTESKVKMMLLRTREKLKAFLCEEGIEL